MDWIRSTETHIVSQTHRGSEAMSGLESRTPLYGGGTLVRLGTPWRMYSLAVESDRGGFRLESANGFQIAEWDRKLEPGTSIEVYRYFGYFVSVPELNYQSWRDGLYQPLALLIGGSTLAGLGLMGLLELFLF